MKNKLTFKLTEDGITKEYFIIKMITNKDNNKNLIYLYYFVLGFGNRGNYSQEEIKPKVINWNRNC